MVKSKRNKKVSLTQVSKKPSGEKKQRLLEDLRDCLDKYEHVFIFSTQNMRNSPLKVPFFSYLSFFYLLSFLFFSFLYLSFLYFALLFFSFFFFFSSFFLFLFLSFSSLSLFLPFPFLSLFFFLALLFPPLPSSSLFPHPLYFFHSGPSYQMGNQPFLSREKQGYAKGFRS